MSRAAARSFALLEPLSIFTMIMSYIWALRYSNPWIWLGILGLILVSHRIHGESAAGLGFRRQDFPTCFRELAPALAFAALILFALGLLFGTTRAIGFGPAFLAWLAYLPWGLFQQYILNGYFLNRLAVVFSGKIAPLAAAALFSTVHLPNPFLMAVTLLAGLLCTRIYRRYNNLYFLGLAHGTIGFLLYLVVPDAVSHHLTVGPGWFGH